jgi:predicted nucleotidyltransferase
MHPAIAEKRKEIADICRRFGVKRLEVFGSAARGDDFDLATSDVDFLVEFEPWARKPWMREYDDLQTELSALLKRPVDLVPARGEGNPRIMRSIHRDKALIYAG